MAGEVFVDVTYRGLELGRRLKLREVGPSTAYLEHGTPMPVGSQVVLATDEGLAIPVVVVRVHEQVAGAEMPPGMRVQASGLEGAAAGWWRELVSRDDPQIPELEVAPMRRPRPLEPPPPPAVAAEPEPPPAAAPDQTDQTQKMPPVDAEVPEDERPTTMMTAVPAPDDMDITDPGGPSKGNGHPGDSPSRTTVMSAQEIRDALGTDPSAPAPTGSDADEGGASGNGETGAEDRGRGRGRGRRRRRR
ncbi:MAG TPA: hypothetical protein VFU21_26275 [Kofleriaceae bacterium]|nr:hypothetical protein [Kofleriaceae bacterium]